MIFVMSKGAILSCSPRFLNISVKFCGASAMPTSSRLGGKLQPLLQRMQGQTGQAADQSAVEADVLQVAPDVELGADRRVARKLAADFDQHGFELTADLAVGSARILLEEGAQALPGAFGDGGDLGPRQQVVLEAFGATRKGLR